MSRASIAGSSPSTANAWRDVQKEGLPHQGARYKLMTFDADGFIRRFLMHVLPDGFHRIRHYGLFANANRAANIAVARQFLGVPEPAPSTDASDRSEGSHDDQERNTCPCCGGRMIIIETFEPGCQPRQLVDPTDRARRLMTITPLSPSPITAPSPKSHVK